MRRSFRFGLAVLAVFAFLQLSVSKSRAIEADCFLLINGVNGPCQGIGGPNFVALQNGATGTTTAIAATLTSSAGVTAFICGINIDAVATAAVVTTGTITGLLGGTLTYQHFVATAATGGGTKQFTFTPCLPASAVNTNIVVNTGTPGAGGVVDISAWGYKQ